MNDKLARMGRPARRAAAVVALAGLVVAVDTTSGSADGVDGRDPDAVPGAVVTTRSAGAPSATEADGRTGEVVLGEPTTRSASPVITDNGRGGADPAQGPNPAVRAAEFVVTDIGEIDTDSGEVAVPNASATAADPAPSAPADEDVPGWSRRAQPNRVVVDEPAVDVDE